MLEKSMYDSWASRIRLFIKGNKNGRMMLDSIDEVTQQSQAEFPQLESGLAVPMFQQGEDPNDCINKAMAFLSVVASRFPSSNNQLRTSSCWVCAHVIRIFIRLGIRKPTGFTHVIRMDIILLGAHIRIHTSDRAVETDIREKDKKSSKNKQNQARNGKA
ncbi:hypothetical protein Tco_1240037 [Tanacetum coccineum]